MGTGAETDMQGLILIKIKMVFHMKQSYIETYKKKSCAAANITLGNLPTEVSDGENKPLQKLSQQSAKFSKHPAPYFVE